MLDNKLIQILPLNNKLLGTTTSKKYNQVDIGLGDTLDFLKFH